MVQLNHRRECFLWKSIFAFQTKDSSHPPVYLLFNSFLPRVIPLVYRKTASWEVRQARRSYPSQWPRLPVHKLRFPQGACNKWAHSKPQRHCSLLWQRSHGELLCHIEKRKVVSDPDLQNEAWRGQDCHLQIHLRLLQHTKDQQLQWRRSPTCGVKNFKAALSSRRLISAYPRFWVFYDCTFLDKSTAFHSRATP